MFLLKIPISGDPAINLAVEEFALRQLDLMEDYLFIYENPQCVMLGKNQNPYEEINPVFLEENKIPLFRRMSGGGTVFHGPGNINFTIITRRENNRVNNYAYFLKPVVDYLNSLGAAARLNNRNDLVIGENKISGNAQFSSRERMFSHGTLLFDTDISRLGDALKPISVVIESKCTQSRRSPVQNILPGLKQAISKKAFVAGLTESLLRQFGHQGTHFLNGKHWAEVQKLAQAKYATDEWVWGRTPRFTIHSTLRGQSFSTNVKNGHIVDFRSAETTVLFEKFKTLLYKRSTLDSYTSILFANYPDKDYNAGEIMHAIYPFE